MCACQQYFLDAYTNACPPPPPLFVVRTVLMVGQPAHTGSPADAKDVAAPTGRLVILQRLLGAVSSTDGVSSGVVKHLSLARQVHLPKHDGDGRVKAKVWSPCPVTPNDGRMMASARVALGYCLRFPLHRPGCPVCYHSFAAIGFSIPCQTHSTRNTDPHSPLPHYLLPHCLLPYISYPHG